MVQQRLLEIAISEFAAKGLEGTSTRGIAAAAGTAMSSITYHYGSKEGLYHAAADYIAERICDHMSLALTADGTPPGTDAAGARAHIQAILARFVDTMTGQESATWSLFIMREQMEPTDAFERIYGGLMGRMLATLVDLVCVATGRREPGTAQIAVIALIGQVIVLRASRATCLKLLDRDDFDGPVTAALKHRIAANTDAILDRLTAERQDPS